MKKMMLMVCAVMCSAAAFATFQWEVVQLPAPTESNANTIYGSPYKIVITSGTGNLYIADKISTLASQNANTEMLSLTTSNRGAADTVTGNFVEYYNNSLTTVVATDTNTMAVAGQDNSGTVVKTAVNSNGDVIEKTGYYLGQFSEGDEVTVWVSPIATDERGAAMFDKSYAVNTDGVDSRTANIGQDAMGDVYHQINFSDTGAVAFTIVGNEVAGQPLPGVLTALLIGGGVGAYMKRRRRA
ncbi:MAG: hypothetical protein PHI35_00940 [Victivallaceae bacterium]|nr:hypothetical protein [Victivallaceae bacterium]